MYTGISTASLFLRQPTEEAAVTVKNLGVHSTEVFLETFYEYRPEFSKALAPKITGLDVNSVHTIAGNFESQLFSPDRRTRGDGFYWLDQVMRSCQYLGCKKYTFHGSRVFGDRVDEIADYLGGIIEFCSRYGVQLCLENVEWCMYKRPGTFSRVKERLPQLAGVFDIKQARRSGYPYAMYIEEMRGAISHVHLSDIDENGKMCLPGKGMYDFCEILKRLKGAGFDGCVLIEAYHDDYGDISELKDSVDFLDEIIYKIG